MADRDVRSQNGSVAELRVRLRVGRRQVGDDPPIYPAARSEHTARARTLWSLPSRIYVTMTDPADAGSPSCRMRITVDSRRMRTGAPL